MSKPKEFLILTHERGHDIWESPAYQKEEEAIWYIEKSVADKLAEALVDIANFELNAGLDETIHNEKEEWFKKRARRALAEYRGEK